jgi:outer membrane biosynthesis protein TonB
MPVQISLSSKFAATGLVMCLLFTGKMLANDRPSTEVKADSSLTAALCQVVYPLDESPEDGYRYMFLGNGFFINRDGYVLTAAHLLSYFRHGGEPYILVGPREGPRRMLEAPIAAVDWDHDVAVLKASPNPFQNEKEIAYLPLSAEALAPGEGVLSASLRPPDVKNAHSSAAPLEDFAQSEAINYTFYQGKDGAEKELLLFGQEVVAGQSGSPVVSVDSHAAVGIVVGQWLHPTVIPSGVGGHHVAVAPGAALRIHYGIALLQQNHIAWDMAPESQQRSLEPDAAPAADANAAWSTASAVPGRMAESTQQTDTPQPRESEGPSLPVPLSIVATYYPPQALYGGDVLLDALVDSSGKLADVKVVAGDSPFVETVLSAVRTWTFEPARKHGKAVGSRVGIVFQFPQSFLPAVVSKDHKHPEVAASSDDHPALPALTIEPNYPANSSGSGNVALYEVVNAEGQLTTTSVLQNVDSLTEPTMAAVRQWKFEPGEKAGVKTESVVIVVVTFRAPTL